MPEILERIATAFAHPTNMRAAYDSVMGAGAYDKLAGELYDQMRVTRLAALAWYRQARRFPKPHLYRVKDVWLCETGASGRCGMGATPAEAYCNRRGPNHGR